MRDDRLARILTNFSHLELVKPLRRRHGNSWILRLPRVFQRFRSVKRRRESLLQQLALAALLDELRRVRRLLAFLVCCRNRTNERKIEKTHVSEERRDEATARLRSSSIGRRESPARESFREKRKEKSRPRSRVSALARKKKKKPSRGEREHNHSCTFLRLRHRVVVLSRG